MSNDKVKMLKLCFIMCALNAVWAADEGVEEQPGAAMLAPVISVREADILLKLVHETVKPLLDKDIELKNIFVMVFRKELKNRKVYDAFINANGELRAFKGKGQFADIIESRVVADDTMRALLHKKL